MDVIDGPAQGWSNVAICTRCEAAVRYYPADIFLISDDNQPHVACPFCEQRIAVSDLPLRGPEAQKTP